MSILMSIAWKNIWRNRLRSIIIMSATSLGIFAGLLLISFSMGMTEARVSTALKTEISHLQIHQPEFIVKDDFKMLIRSADSIETVLHQNFLITGCSPRIRLNTIVSSARTGTSVKITGIDPMKERRVTDLSSKIIEGDYFEKERLNPIILGQKLADKLKVKLNSKVVIQLHDLQGNIFPAAFRIAGIYKTTNSAYDELNLFVLNKDLLKLTGIDPTSCHEIAICLKDYQQSKIVQDEMKRQFTGLEILTWKELDVMLSYMSGSMDHTSILSWSLF